MEPPFPHHTHGNHSCFHLPSFSGKSMFTSHVTSSKLPGRPSQGSISPAFCISLHLLLLLLHHPSANTISDTAEWHFRPIQLSIIITNRCKCLIMSIEYCLFVTGHVCQVFDLLYICILYRFDSQYYVYYGRHLL